MTDSQNEAKDMVLLGAGASIEAGLPDSYDMTTRISEYFHEDPYLQRHSHVISFVIGGLLFQQGIQGVDPSNFGVNVEELFNAVHTLAERDTLEISPFVRSWHEMVQEFDKGRPDVRHLRQLNTFIHQSVTREMLKALRSFPPSSVQTKIDRELRNIINKSRKQDISYSSFSFGYEIDRYLKAFTKDWLDRMQRQTPVDSSSFAREFSRAFEGLKDKPGGGQIFKETAEIMIHTLIRIVWIDQADRVEYLKPLLNILQSQKSITIATLNYDNSIELLAESSNIKYETGIKDWSTSGTFKASNDGIFLLKLHGSIDWSLDEEKRSDEHPMFHRAIRKIDKKDMQEVRFRPAILFGGRTKLTVEGPFLDLLRSFKQELFTVNRLTIIGYSFRDPHINEYISQWLNQDRKNRIRIINPDFPGKKNEYAPQLINFCKERVEIFNENTGSGLNKVFLS